jgi:CDP-paratose 2-epimerase
VPGLEHARVLVTGGAGFIGANLSMALARQGNEVCVLDNLSREGVRRNAAWLGAAMPERIEIRHGDVRDPDSVRDAARNAQVVYHLAGQVAVTTSVADPRLDFEVNAQGTLNVLEAARRSAGLRALVYTSTNKVYGGMEDLEVVERGWRYEYAGLPEGVDETRPLDFHSPYGCSKGAADQYVRDYARIYGLPTVVFRMSCIYGPRQFGNEDQGWVAHFARAALGRQPVKIFGDGKQIRDILFVEDLVRAFCLATERIEATRGQVYNIGGGPGQTLSLLELVAELERQLERPLALSFHEWRPGDQRVYVTNPRKAARDFGWQPAVGNAEGLRRLVQFLSTDAAAARPDDRRELANAAAHG